MFKLNYRSLYYCTSTGIPERNFFFYQKKSTITLHNLTSHKIFVSRLQVTSSRCINNHYPNEHKKTTTYKFDIVEEGITQI
jgi:hypothetical protein